MSKTYYDCAEVDWEQQRLVLDTGVTMAYYECGPKDGKTVLLIHGVTDGCVAWAQIAPVLEKAGCHCYIVEYRGNGMTDKPDMGPSGYTGELLAGDIIEMIEKLDLQDIHVVGHSFGSLITQILAVKIPQRCADYTLIDTAVDCRSNPVLLGVRNGDDDFPGLDHYPDGLPDQFLQDWTAMGNESEAFRMAELEHVRQMPMVSWKNLMDGLLQFNSSDFIGDIHGDVLVLWGTEDDIFPKADQDQVKAGLTGCNVQYIDVEGASHNGFWDSLAMVETYAGHILDFIEKN